MYVAGSERTRERIARIAGEHELNARVELLETVVEEALEARRAARVA
jgi:hypothetical protein